MKKHHVPLFLFLLSFTYAHAQSAGDIIITEFIPDPVKVADGSGEWLEIYNTTDHAININKWQLKDGASKNHRINHKTALLVQPSGFLLLSVKADSSMNGGLRPDYVYSSFSFPNNNGKLLITDSSGVVIDSVSYTAATPGKSWNLDPAHFDGKANDNKDNWCVATHSYGLGDFGTPKSANTKCVNNSIQEEHPFSSLQFQLFNDELSILLPEKTEEQTWDIWSFSGQRMQSGICPPYSKQLSVSLIHLSSGVYLFRLSKTGAIAKFVRP